MVFVVEVGHLSRTVQRDKRIVIASLLFALDAQNHGCASSGVRNHLKRGSGSVEQVRHRRFGPDDQVGLGQLCGEIDLTVEEQRDEIAVPFLVLRRVGLDQADREPRWVHGHRVEKHSYDKPVDARQRCDAQSDKGTPLDCPSSTCRQYQRHQRHPMRAKDGVPLRNRGRRPDIAHKSPGKPVRI